MNHSYFGKRWILSSFLLLSITVLLTGCEERKVTFMKKILVLLWLCILLPLL